MCVFPGEVAVVQPGFVEEVEVEAAVGDGEGDPEGHYLGEDPLAVEGGRIGLVPVLGAGHVDHGEGGEDARRAHEQELQEVEREKDGD